MSDSRHFEYHTRPSKSLHPVEQNVEQNVRQEQESLQYIKWEYEDNLPNMPDHIYASMYTLSQVRDGVRMFPYFISGTERIYLAE